MSPSVFVFSLITFNLVNFKHQSKNQSTSVGNTNTLLPYRNALSIFFFFPFLFFLGFRRDWHRIVPRFSLTWHHSKPSMPLLLLLYVSCVSFSPKQDGIGMIFPAMLHCGGNNGAQPCSVPPASLIWRVRPTERSHMEL